jgi:hypothetical protein
MKNQCHLQVVLGFSEPVQNLREVAANVAQGILNHAMDIGIAPEAEDAHTTEIVVGRNDGKLLAHVMYEGMVPRFQPVQAGTAMPSMELASQKRIHNGIEHAKQIIQKIELLRSRDGYDEELLETDIHLLIGILTGEIQEKTDAEYLIVSDEGYWNDVDGWVYSYDDASRYPDMSGTLPIAENIRWERVIDYSDKVSVQAEIARLTLEMDALQRGPSIDLESAKLIHALERKIDTLQSAKDGAVVIPTPRGLISVITATDPAYPGVFVDINGDQAARVEYKISDKAHQVSVWLEKNHSDDSHAVYTWDEDPSANDSMRAYLTVTPASNVKDNKLINHDLVTKMDYAWSDWIQVLDLKEQKAKHIQASELSLFDHLIIDAVSQEQIRPLHMLSR